MTAHKQVFVQVKTLVDSGIKDVVEALNLIPEVWTIDSCQGDKDSLASVSLNIGTTRDYKKVANFADKLFQATKNYNLDVMVEWTNTTIRSPYIDILFRNADAKAIADAVKSAFCLIHDNTHNRTEPTNSDEAP